MKIAVGMSGGVDSSVTAHLLVSQGHEVIGLFIKTWDDTDPNCPAAKDAADARSVADQLGIPFFSFDLSEVYKKDVFAYFLSEHKKGRTPNPDIFCNRYVKFGAMLEKAMELGAEKLATGHYASVSEEDGEYKLKLPKDKNKDQTYFLHSLSQDQLSKTLFPLSDLTKPEIRKIAQEQGFVTADKKDSVGICMVGDRDYFEFLEQHTDKSPGEIIECDTKKVLGTHNGLHFYTLGQRKNLHIGGVSGFEEAPWFVVHKDFEKNQLLVSQDESKLDATVLIAEDLHWIGSVEETLPFECTAKVRYRSESVPCVLSREKEDLMVTFKSPVRAATPGQFVVFYDQDACLGGAVIQKAITRFSV